ncbi:MFS transporter [Pseudomonas sp. JG-B]|uniref:MFS transporter n=1 Tax=Pseudomonas sp. JG-B TaxID=2603214 RepID=UPI00129D4A1E|nr:MFS transporter [Pseudomonas sp. JG-B]MRK21888.1 MFS transporter [Pseudomonas sp. JG-B]
MSSPFFGRKVVLAAFMTALFGWGVGFYGPPVFLYAVTQRTGWPVPLCSAAVTLHFLAGTLVVVNLPHLYKRFGIPRISLLGSFLLCAGVCGWAVAREPWQLFIAAMLSGFGWVTMGAAAINAMIAPWFISGRPSALSMAYNGASIGGVVFSSGWVFLINHLGFPQAALVVSVLTLTLVGFLAWKVYGVHPEHLGQHPDGAKVDPSEATPAQTAAEPLLWRNRRFLTLASSMALGLFAQIGLIAHMFLLLTPLLSDTQAGFAMGLATLSAIAGRVLVGRHMSASADRRIVACASYGSQLLGCLLLMAMHAWPGFIWIGIVLFGAGIGNATSLPPSIAQAEFPRHLTQRVVSLIVAISQGGYAFAPALFGLMKSLTLGWLPFGLAAGLQVAAMLLLMLGRRAPGSMQDSSRPPRPICC